MTATMIFIVCSGESQWDKPEELKEKAEAPAPVAAPPAQLVKQEEPPAPVPAPAPEQKEEPKQEEPKSAPGPKKNKIWEMQVESQESKNY